GGGIAGPGKLRRTCRCRRGRRRGRRHPDRPGNCLPADDPPRPVGGDRSVDLLSRRRQRPAAGTLERTLGTAAENCTHFRAPFFHPGDPRAAVMIYFVLKYLHVIGAAVLLGTGAGIAFFLLRAHQTGDAATIAAVARIVVFADFLFTATAVVAQPGTGVALAVHMGYPLGEHWIALSIVLYIVTGVFWLPVVWIQMELGRLAAAASADGVALSARYLRLFRVWFAFGFPAFGAVMAIF